MTEELDTGGVLTRTNATIHEAQEEALLRTVEALTRLDLGAARSLFDELCRAMDEHLVEEERESHRHYALLDEHPRGANPELFEADHVSLSKVITTCRESFDALETDSDGLRRRVVLALPLFYRLRSVLEHHTLREQRFLYPRLDTTLEDDELERLARRLLRTIPRGS